MFKCFVSQVVIAGDQMENTVGANGLKGTFSFSPNPINTLPDVSRVTELMEVREQ